MTNEDRIAINELLELHLSPLKAKLESHDESLYGNGREGVVVRVDRLEQARAAAERGRTLRATLWVGAAVAGIGNIVAFIIRMLGG